MREVNYWSEKTQISDALPENEWQKNYDLFMNNLHGHAFAQFLAETGISAKDTTKFLIDALTYVNEHKEQFDT